VSTSTYKHVRTLELPKLNTARYRWRNLCVQIQRTLSGHYRAVLIDLEEFRGEALDQTLAINDLANELEHVAAEIRRESGSVVPNLDRVRAVYDAVCAWRAQIQLVPSSQLTQDMLCKIDAALASEEA